MTVNLE